MPNCICGKKAYYGKRIINGEKGKATHCASCNKLQNLGLVNVSVQLCEFDLGDGNLCPSQKKHIIDEKKLCGKHAVGLNPQPPVKECSIEDCIKKAVKGGFCRKCGIKNGIKLHDQCVDCKTKRGSFKIDNQFLCKKCKDNLLENNSDIVVSSINPICEGIECTKRPTYSPGGQTPALRCKKCCEGMDGWGSINPKYTKPKVPKERKPKKDPKIFHQCIFDGCTRSRVYGFESDGKRLVCSEHIDTLEIRENDPVICVIKSHHCDCGKSALYGVDEATHCYKCKEDHMKLMRNSCMHEECNKQPCYGFEMKKPTYCANHKLEGMVEVKTKRCALCNINSTNNTYKPNCTQCHFYLHPDDPRIRNYKTKEHTFMIPLKDIFPDMILDKTIEGGCSRRRPDGFIDCFTHLVIVEIDEDQHIGYDQMCENRRIIELYMDVASRPIVFIRLNPDGYYENNKRVNGVFSKTKLGELKCNNQEFNIRFDTLKATVHRAINTIPEREITITELFYSI